MGIIIGGGIPLFHSLKISVYRHEKSVNHISLSLLGYVLPWSHSLCRTHISANARPPQLCWGDWEVVHSRVTVMCFIPGLQ